MYVRGCVCLLLTDRHFGLSKKNKEMKKKTKFKFKDKILKISLKLRIPRRIF